MTARPQLQQTDLDRIVSQVAVQRVFLDEDPARRLNTAFDAHQLEQDR